MKEMKRFLAFLVSVVMIFSCITAFADSFDTEGIQIGGDGTTTTTTTTTKPSTTKTTTTTTTKPTTTTTTKPTTTNNDDFNTDPIPMGCTTHAWDSGKVTKKATASANGSILYNCQNCDATKTIVINKIGDVKLSQTSYVYNGKIKTPTIKVLNSKGKAISSKYYTVTVPKGRKNVGTYTYKIVFNTRYKLTKSLSFTIKPSAPTGISLSALSNGINVKWNKKTAQVTGYRVRYSKYENFKNPTTKTISSNNTTSRKITGLKSKTKYYVKIQTYKTVTSSTGKKTTYYSAWSSAKSIKTR